MAKINKQKNQTFWAEIKFLNNGDVKISRAKRLVNLNQYKGTWKTANSRNLARELNNCYLVIK